MRLGLGNPGTYLKSSILAGRLAGPNMAGFSKSLLKIRFITFLVDSQKCFLPSPALGWCPKGSFLMGLPNHCNDQYLNLLPQPGEGSSVLFVLALKRALKRSPLAFNQGYLALHLVQLRDKKTTMEIKTHKIFYLNRLLSFDSTSFMFLAFVNRTYISSKTSMTLLTFAFELSCSIFSITQLQWIETICKDKKDQRNSRGMLFTLLTVDI